MTDEKDSVRAEVMRLHYLEGLPIRAIARRLRLARRTVKRHLGTLAPRVKSVQPRTSLLECQRSPSRIHRRSAKRIQSLGAWRVARLGVSRRAWQIGQADPLA